MSATVKITSGSQSFRRSSGKLSAFVMDGDGSNKRKLHSKALTANGSGTQIRAHKNDINQFGAYYAQNFTSVENTVICLQASLSKGGAPYSEAMLFISLRDDAPLVTIDFLPLPDRDSSIEKVEAFTGRGDLLDKDELEAYGIKLTKIQMKNFFNDDEVKEIFNITTIECGNEKPTLKVLKSSTGESKIIKVPSKVKRKLRLK